MFIQFNKKHFPVCEGPRDHSQKLIHPGSLWSLWGSKRSCSKVISPREFVEQYEIQISERAVGYVNTDVCMSVSFSWIGGMNWMLKEGIQGPILLPAASPTLGGLYEDAVKDVTSPENDEESYYDYWSRWSGQEGNFTPEVAFNPYPWKVMLFPSPGFAVRWSWEWPRIISLLRRGPSHGHNVCRGSCIVKDSLTHILLDSRQSVDCLL